MSENMRSKRRSKVREKMREESMTERKRRERVRKHGDQREEEKGERGAMKVLSRSKYLLHYTLLCVAPSDIIAHDSHKTSMV